VPVAKPVISTAIILTFLACWNDFPLARIMLNSPDVRTISLAAAYFKGTFSTNYAMMTSGCVILIIPQLLILRVPEIHHRRRDGRRGQGLTRRRVETEDRDVQLRQGGARHQRLWYQASFPKGTPGIDNARYRAVKWAKKQSGATRHGKLEMEHLSAEYQIRKRKQPVQIVRALNDFSLQVGDGELLALTGPSGVGNRRFCAR
jgi:ABC-type multidrug transport system fused ATPase/permease subunit